MQRDRFAQLLAIVLPLSSMWWNLAHLNIGLVDFYGLSAFAQGFAANGAWPATPYFPAGYPLLLVPCGYTGSTLIGGYCLSAIGIMLALYSVWLLARHHGVDQLWAAMLIILCWAAPVCRVVSGSPSVDALYTGMSMWFLASAIVAWQCNRTGLLAGQGSLPKWARVGLIVPACVLPLLRYHAVVLLLPVSLVLLAHQKIRRVGLLAITAVTAGVVFNYATYFAAYNEPLATASLLQVWTGLELHYHRLYASADFLWANYTQFCDVARNQSLLHTYSSKDIASVVLMNWIMYLRQPAVFLLVAFTAGIAVWRRPVPTWLMLGFVWTLAYTLLLSSTYYTARAALLPVFVATALTYSALHTGITARWKYAALVLVSGLFLIGYQLGGRYAGQYQEDCRRWSADSRQFEILLQERKLERQQVYSADWRILPLRDNAWTAPYSTGASSWIDDPLIRPKQRDAIQRIDVMQLCSGATDKQLALTYDGVDGGGLYDCLTQSPFWRAQSRLTQHSLLVFGRATSFGDGADQAAP